jgi:hypothetical protein
LAVAGCFPLLNVTFVFLFLRRCGGVDKSLTGRPPKQPVHASADQPLHARHGPEDHLPDEVENAMQELQQIQHVE